MKNHIDPGLVISNNHLLAHVQQALVAKGCRVFVADQPQQVIDYITAIARNGNKVVVARFDLARELDLVNSLTTQGVKVYDVSSCGRNEILSMDVGITGADVVIGETGTIFLVENDGEARMVSIVTPIHIAITEVGAIVPTLAEGLKKVRSLSKEKYNCGLANYVTAISGPSRTADIEFKMAFGMHGPIEVHVIIVGTNTKVHRG